LEVGTSYGSFDVVVGMAGAGRGGVEGTCLALPPPDGVWVIT